MTRKEFIKKVGAKGYTVSNPTHATVVKKNYLVIAYINEERVGIIDTTYANWNDSDAEAILGIITEYALTPLEDREEPKKYHLWAKYAGSSSGSYLNKDLGRKIFFFSDSVGVPLVQTEFTEEEISQMPEWCQAMKRFEVK